MKLLRLCPRPGEAEKHGVLLVAQGHHILRVDTSSVVVDKLLLLTFPVILIEVLLQPGPNLSDISYRDPKLAGMGW